MSFVKAPGQMLGGVRSTWACGHSGTSSLQGSGRRTSRCSHAQVARSVLSDRPSSGSTSEGSDEKGSVFHKGGDLPKVPKKDGKVVLNDRYLDSAQYIWNVNFEEAMDRKKVIEERAQKRAEEQAKAKDGALNLNGLRSIYNSLATPEALLVRPTVKSSYDEEDEIEESPLSAIDMAIKPVSKLSSPYSLVGYKYVPTRNEKKRWAAEWEQASRFSQGHSMMEIRDKAAMKESEEEMERKRKEAEESYDNLKTRLGLYTGAISIALSADAYYQWGADTAFSFAVGSIGSLLYLRLLSNKVDTFGGGGDIRAVFSPPSMTAPIILFMLHDRFNTLYAARFGVELLGLPLLLGFLTYKASTIVQVLFDLQELDEQEALRAEGEEEEVFRGVDMNPGFKKYYDKPAFGAWD